MYPRRKSNAEEQVEFVKNVNGHQEKEVLERDPVGTASQSTAETMANGSNETIHSITKTNSAGSTISNGSSSTNATSTSITPISTVTSISTDTQKDDPLAARLRNIRGPRPYPDSAKQPSSSPLPTDNMLSTSPPNNYIPQSSPSLTHDLHHSTNNNNRPDFPPSNTLNVPRLSTSSSRSPSPSLIGTPPPSYDPPPPPSPQPPSKPQNSAPTISFTNKYNYNTPIIYPKTNIINTETLAKYLMYVPESILLLDIRDRRSFDNGHISAPNLVCIEPVSLRAGMNDDTLEDTLVIAPETEQEIFSRRSSFELVVYYDSDSRTNSYRGGPVSDAQSIALYYLTTAIYDYAFSKPLKRPPCLLIGGYGAWWDDFNGRNVSKSLTRAGAESDSSGVSENLRLSASSVVSVPAVPASPTVPQEIPSRPYGSRKGSLVSTQSFARDINEYIRSAPSLTDTSSANGYASDRNDYHIRRPSIDHSGGSHRDSYSDPYQYQRQQQQYHQQQQQQQQKLQKQQYYQQEHSRRSSYASNTQYVPQPHYHSYPHENNNSNGYPLSQNTSAPLIASPRPVVVYPYNSSGAPTNPAAIAGPGIRPSTSVPPPPSDQPLNGYTRPVSSTSLMVSARDIATKEFTTGLKNLGNTCYMNCIIQCLAGTPKLADVFCDNSYRQYVNVNSKLGYKGILAQTYAGLVQRMYQEKESYVPPLALKDLSGRLRETFRGYEQQDCQEFLTFILDGLHEELNSNGDKERLKELTEDEERRREGMSVRVASTIEWERYLKSDYSLIVDIAQGQYQSHLRCLTCGHTSTTYNSFSFLSLPIPLNKQSVSLQECFDLFTAEEILDGDDAWHCSKCKKPRRTSKVLRIARFPPILIIHLKRFQQRRGFIGNSISDKLETPVAYPVSNLNMTTYWPDYSEGDEQQLGRLPIRGQTAPFIYDLYAVANHSGTLKGGHYTSFVRKGRKGWCYFDDTRINIRVPQERVVNRQAYVLFYERRPVIH